jgi:hypothetical protein
MTWYDNLIGLFKREVPEAEFEALFSRMDVDQFFTSLSNIWYPGELIAKIGGLHNLPLLYKDSEIYAAIDKRIAALLSTRLVFEGGDPALNKFFTEQLTPHERQLKQDFWWSIAYGYGVEQIIYNEDRSGKVSGFQREEFWRFEPLPDLIHAKCIQSTNPAVSNKVLPYGKWVLTTNNATASNPIGEAMLERVIQPWIFRCNGWDLWMDFAKKFANGFMHGRIMDSAQAATFRATLEKAAKSAIIVTDKETELNMIQPSRDSAIYQMIDEKTSQSIQRVILGETLSSSMQLRGSTGAASIHNEVRVEKTLADIAHIEHAITETMRQIAAVNEFSGNLPTVKLIYDPGLNLELAQRDSVLTTTGIKFSKEYYKSKYGLKDEEFEIATPEPSLFSEKKKSYLSLSDVKQFIDLPESCQSCDRTNLDATVKRRDTRQLAEKDETVDFLIKNGDAPLDIEDLISAISNSKNEKELDENLTSLFDSRNNGFVDTMTKTLYYAATKGALVGNPEKVEAD